MKVNAPVTTEIATTQTGSFEKEINDEKNVAESNVDNIEIDTPKKSYAEMLMDIKMTEKLEQMTLEEKVAQMFIIFPESLVDGVNNVTMATELTQKSIEEIPVGGVVYMSENLRNPEQVKTMLENIQGYSMDRIGLPLFLCVDEEGGRIARIANNRAFGVDNNVGSMTEIGKINDYDTAYEAGARMGEYLAELGFNLDFAPVVDVDCGTYNSVMNGRTFSEDPKVVSSLGKAVSKGLNSKGIISVYKHFPGHGSTKGDPHTGYAVTQKTIGELKNLDLIPFEEGIDDGVPMIMVGHISLPNVIGDDTPASLSKKIITDILREDMEYDGVVITDAMNMGAVKDNYESDEAALMAITAGADIVLMPKEFDKAYEAVLSAVKNGTVTEDRIDESVTRILRLKMNFNK